MVDPAAVEGAETPDQTVDLIAQSRNNGPRSPEISLLLDDRGGALARQRRISFQRTGQLTIIVYFWGKRKLFTLKAPPR
jgi:hypothetical protein